MTLRALELWRAHDPRRRLLHETGVLWLFGDDDGFGHTSARVLRDHGARLDVLPLAEASRRFPQVAFDGVRSVFWEPDAGYLLARRACEDVVERLTEEGGEYPSGRSARAAGRGRRRPSAACHSRTGRRSRPMRSCSRAGRGCRGCFRTWWGRPSPRLAPGGALLRHGAGRCALHRARAAGVDGLRGRVPRRAGLRRSGVRQPPASRWRTTRQGRRFDPSSGERIVSPEGVAKARAFLSRRFPGLADAPLDRRRKCVSTRTRPTPICVVDRHPRGVERLDRGRRLRPRLQDGSRRRRDDGVACCSTTSRRIRSSACRASPTPPAGAGRGGGRERS